MWRDPGLVVPAGRGFDVAANVFFSTSCLNSLSADSRPPRLMVVASRRKYFLATEIRSDYWSRDQ
jgi:hypothetical protein